MLAVAHSLPDRVIAAVRNGSARQSAARLASIAAARGCGHGCGHRTALEQDPGPASGLIRAMWGYHTTPYESDVGVTLGGASFRRSQNMPRVFTTSVKSVNATGFRT